MVRFVLALTALALPVAASANCDALIKKGNTAEGPALIQTYTSLIACDKAEAEAAYSDFLKQTGDVSTMVDLSLTAIDAQIFMPVWRSLEQLKDYSARDETAKSIGAQCQDHPQVLVFLKGAYHALKNIRFSQWDDAYIACPSDEIQGWLQARVEEPPALAFDEKYNTILSIWVDRERVDALPSLQKAAITASGNDGPFNSILEAMDSAVQPTAFGEDVDPEHATALKLSLVELAGQVGPERARLVADRLFNAGSEAEAASLLPAIYPDRVQAGGSLMYGVIAVEACDKDVVLHYAAVTEPATRWSVVEDVSEPARDVKPKLKCTAEEPWVVLVTPEPVTDSNEVKDWVEELEPQWTAKGLSVKTKSESDIELSPRE